MFNNLESTFVFGCHISVSTFMDACTHTLTAALHRLIFLAVSSVSCIIKFNHQLTSDNSTKLFKLASYQILRL